jgi:sec-independent protein translocase protein TatA
MQLLAFFNFSPGDMIIIAVVAVLLFGDRLPQVMRSVGQGMSEFKKGMRGIEEQIEAATNAKPTSRVAEIEDREEPIAPRFDPPPSAPREVKAPEHLTAQPSESAKV